MLEKVLKEMPDSYRWIFAGTDLLKDIYLAERTPIFGPRGRLVRRIVSCLPFHWLRFLFIVSIASIDVTCLRIKAGRQKEELPRGCRIFVGFGAGPEKGMWKAYETESETVAIRLDETEFSSWGKYKNLSIVKLWSSVWALASAEFRALSSANEKALRDRWLDTFTCLGLGLSRYVFYREWWLSLRDSELSEVVFISADKAAHACIDAGIRRVKYRQHGLLRKSIVMPKFEHARFLTAIEAAWFANFLPRSQIEVLEGQTGQMHHDKVMLFTSVFDTDTFSRECDLPRVRAIVEWAQTMGLRILVRKHPREEGGFWETHFPQLEVDASPDNFEQVVRRVCPMFVVSWFSTCLVDALKMNVVPVSVMSPGHELLQDIVFNVETNCLLWPKAREVMEILTEGRVSVESVVLSLSADRQ
ncbi:MAG: hypothetical protein H7A51_00020 [Akkermansiaceae bacterium]|nr:hypothetical protein [Akkermansiaceae bacterium]